MSIYQNGGVSQNFLPLGAVPICNAGACVQTTPSAMRQLQAYDSNSYYKFYRAQTLPYQDAFSGMGQTCNGCPANRYAVWVPSQPATESLSPAPFTTAIMPNYPIIPATSSLPPVTTGTASYAQSVIEGYMARVPYLGMPGCGVGLC
jgi:hypothetical protein